MKFNFLKPTMIFSAVGIFIPGFTAIVFFLFQTLFDKLGVDCETYWKLLIAITSVLAIITPLFYFKYLEKYRKPTQANLLLFNFLEYCFLQISIGQLFVSSNTICFGQSDGGLVLVFTAWLALPILVCLSFIFKSMLRD
ncbi:hypothetical protein [Flavobacterium soli]|uniref:hypothetical protein n=1 Tax=Flavobacterium soli TaxID=344881 RepID=UPI000404F086|nr:hypothetical protein [Flavobacterium soli]